MPVGRAPELPYPSCEAGAPVGSEVLFSGSLQSGEHSIDRSVSERFELQQRGCLRVMTVRQEWPLTVSDVEVVYDQDLRPLRAWKRMTLPGARADGQPDIRRYELRTPQVMITRRDPAGHRSFEWLRGRGEGAPTVVLGPGRGLLSMWLRRARLGPGERVSEMALDIRGLVEELRPVALRREPDLYQPAYGRVLRVYTVYGRESVFADERDVVVGDIAGMRPPSLAGIPAPLPLPMFGAPDPVNTP